jgi:hypothetical protein
LEVDPACDLVCWGDVAAEPENRTQNGFRRAVGRWGDWRG